MSSRKAFRAPSASPIDGPIGGRVAWLFPALGAAFLVAFGAARPAAASDPAAPDPSAPDHGEIRGVTISCQTWGAEWGTDQFALELDELRALGANWVAIHPYARIHADGRLSWRAFDPAAPPGYLARPIAEARARGLAILVKPHLAYWGSPFRWRGEIAFEDAEARARFFRDYGAWMSDLALATRDADAFCVGTELDQLTGDEGAWRDVIAQLRERTPALLTYAANWDSYPRVGFWDALDAVGIQAYFPLSELDDPSVDELRRGWQPVLEELRGVHAATGKPIVFTELGYDSALGAAREPWAPPRPQPDERERGEALQARCLRVALGVLAEERAWLRGAFLWKWFPGAAPRADFKLQTPTVRELLRDGWRR